MSKLLEIEGYRLVNYRYSRSNGSFGMFFSRSSGQQVKFDFRDFDNKAIRDKFSVWLDDCFRFEEKIIASNFPFPFTPFQLNLFLPQMLFCLQILEILSFLFMTIPRKKGAYPSRI